MLGVSHAATKHPPNGDPNQHQQPKTTNKQQPIKNQNSHVVEHTQIDEINILNATLTAMGAALAALPARPDVALVDGNRPPKPEMLPEGLKVETIIKGDASVYCIAAASIIAKVCFVFLALQKQTTAVLGWVGVTTSNLVAQTKTIKAKRKQHDAHCTLQKTTKKR